MGSPLRKSVQPHRFARAGAENAAIRQCLGQGCLPAGHGIFIAVYKYDGVRAQARTIVYCNSLYDKSVPGRLQSFIRSFRKRYFIPNVKSSILLIRKSEVFIGIILSKPVIFA